MTRVLLNFSRTSGSLKSVNDVTNSWKCSGTHLLTFQVVLPTTGCYSGSLHALGEGISYWDTRVPSYSFVVPICPLTRAPCVWFVACEELCTHIGKALSSVSEVAFFVGSSAKPREIPSHCLKPSARNPQKLSAASSKLLGLFFLQSFSSVVMPWPGLGHKGVVQPIYGKPELL